MSPTENLWDIVERPILTRDHTPTYIRELRRTIETVQLHISSGFSQILVVLMYFSRLKEAIQDTRTHSLTFDMYYTNFILILSMLFLIKTRNSASWDANQNDLILFRNDICLKNYPWSTNIFFLIKILNRLIIYQTVCIINITADLLTIWYSCLIYKVSHVWCRIGLFGKFMPTLNCLCSNTLNTSNLSTCLYFQLEPISNYLLKNKV